MAKRVSAEPMRRSRLLSGTKAVAGRKSTQEMSMPCERKWRETILNPPLSIRTHHPLPCLLATFLVVVGTGGPVK
eukprot:2385656-Pyramimonas_sp.AAC.1